MINKLQKNRKNIKKIKSNLKFIALESINKYQILIHFLLLYVLFMVIHL
jgi:hypothetical protein